MRFGLVGTGHWAGTVHGPGLAAHPDVEFVGVWGRDQGRTAAIADARGVIPYADLDQLIDDVDAVSFAVPPRVQAELAVRVAKAGRHLLLEKPIALDTAAANAIVAASAGVQSVVFFAQRFVEGYEEWFQDALSRDLQGARYEWLSSDLSVASPYFDSAWRREVGALWDLGPHVLSMLLPLLGPVDDIAGLRGADDLVHLVLRHSEGASSTVSLSLTAPAPRGRLEVYDGNGWSVLPDASYDEAYPNAVSALVASVCSGTSHACNVRFGSDVVALLERCDDALTRCSSLSDR